MAVARAKVRSRRDGSAVPLDELDRAIERCVDGKSLVGLLWFRAYLRDER